MKNQCRKCLLEDSKKTFQELLAGISSICVQVRRMSISAFTLTLSLTFFYFHHHFLKIYDKSDLTAAPFKFANPVSIRSLSNRHWGSGIASNNRYLVIGCRDFYLKDVRRQGVAYVYDISNKAMTANDIPNNLIQVHNLLNLYSFLFIRN